MDSAASAAYDSQALGCFGFRDLHSALRSKKLRVSGLGLRFGGQDLLIWGLGFSGESHRSSGFEGPWRQATSSQAMSLNPSTCNPKP